MRKKEEKQRQIAEQQRYARYATKKARKQLPRTYAMTNSLV
jgi:hypothetical protein